MLIEQDASAVASFVAAHEGTFAVALAWVSKESPALWNKLVSVYPYCAANGGVAGIVKKFFAGESNTAVVPVVVSPTTSTVSTSAPVTLKG